MGDGDVQVVRIGAEPGPVVDLLTLGAAIHRLDIVCGDGRRRNVALGHDRVEDRLTSPFYIGGTIGRYANRIAGGRFELDGQTVQVATNDRGNTLHGGPDGLDRRNFAIVEHRPDSVTFALTSPDGDQGFPGVLDLRIRYAVHDDGLEVTQQATADAATVVNLTNHAYLNLEGAGAGPIDHHLLRVLAQQYTPVDEAALPLGEHEPVEHTRFDLRKLTSIPAGIDHNFVIDGAGMRHAAELSAPRTNTRVDVWSDQPGLQVHTLEFPPGSARGGVALEPQLPPDTPNHPDWPSARLGPGEQYTARIRWRFSALRTGRL
ncbi:aldose epimerase family protein [Aeromicrobium sp. CF3.5]|uniref:aldose epimerase family protein n=1 Tax=Aeromicrobium sp. CF3.5 TaxID=3373078 RepID=UPI003EE6E7B8